MTTSEDATSATNLPKVKRCSSYLQGHTTHYIAPLRVYADTPKDPITVTDVDAEGWITFHDKESGYLRWWHHDAPRMVALWREGAPFARVRGSHFVVAQSEENSFSWLYCADSPSPCVTQPSADPIEALRNEGGFVMSLEDQDTGSSDDEN